MYISYKKRLQSAFFSFIICFFILLNDFFNIQLIILFYVLLTVKNIKLNMKLINHRLK